VSRLRLLTTHQIDAARFITRHFGLGDFAEAYEVFGNAADTRALKVVLTR
jgi:alcohol dehydrogenase